MKHFLKLIKSENGATAPEYAIIAALIAGAIILVVTDLGVAVQTIFTNLVDAMP